MARSATLDVRVLLDAAQAASGLNEVAGKFESFGKKLTGAVIGAVAIGGITELAKTVVSSASTMQQAVGGTDKVFGANASQIHSWASDTTDSIRLPAAAVEKFATLIKTQLAATGEPIDKLTADTKKLVQIGADLAAVTGADLGDAIAAVKSALAGEFDPIQNLGVAMTAATVNAKALEIAHGDLAAASSSTVQEQARVAEIMDKSAFATGAAAEETDTFQGRMDSLKEQASGLAVAIGGPLLDSLGNIVGAAGDAAAGATTLGTGLGTMLGTVLQLPVPIQAVGAGLLAFAAVSAKWGTAAAGAFTSFIGSIKSATTSVGGLKTALAGIGPALAGGALIVGAAVLVGLFAQAIGRVTEGAKKGEDALQGYRDAIVAAGGASTAATAEAFKQAVTTSDAFSGLIEGGFSAAEAVKILTGTQEDWIAVQSGGSDAARNLTKDTLAMTNGFIDANGHAKTLAQAQIDGAKAMGTAGDAAATLGPTIADAETAAADAAKKAEQAQKDLADAIKAAQEAASRTIVSRALDGFKNAAEDATRAIDFLGISIDAITGGTRTYEEAQASFNKTISAIPDAFKAATEAGGLNQQALVDWNVQALTQNKTGQDVYDTLTTVRSGYESLVGTAYASANASRDNAAALQEAQNNAGYAYDSFIGMATAMGLSDDQARTLAQNLGVLNATQLDPKIFQLIADDTAARDTVKQLQAQGFDPIHFTLEAGADAALGTVDDVITYIDAAGTKSEVSIHGDAAPANATVDGLTKDINSTTGTMTVAANPAPANTTADQTASGVAGRRDAVLTVGSNTTAFQESVSALVRDVSIRQAKLTVTADTGPASSSIAAITGAYYSATVHVIADTSSFFATFNSLPKSSGVGAAPKMLVPSGFAAPVLQAGSTGAPVSARAAQQGSVTINVSGAIDPDSTARQIRQILDRRDRRIGGIVI